MSIELLWHIKTSVSYTHKNIYTYTHHTAGEIAAKKIQRRETKKRRRRKNFQEK